MPRNFIYFVLLTLFLSTGACLAQQDGVESHRGFFSRMVYPDSNQTLRYKVLPILTYAPETRFGFGAGVILNWDDKDASEGTHSSLAQSFFFYTQNDQIDWSSLFEYFTNENKFYFSGSLGYIRFPQLYFGVGNDVKEEDSERFSFQQFYLDLRNRFKVSNKIYLGVDYYLNRNYDLQWIEGSKYANDPELIGTQGYLVSGLGPEFLFDSRDTPFLPDQGIFFSASMLFFDKFLGSEYTYQRLELDYRHFISIYKEKHWTLAFNLYGQFTRGEVPFNRIPALGSAQIMRGYYSGRFRDHNYIAAQLEWRMPIWKIIALRVWGGAGQVATDFAQFNSQGFKGNFGVGLRIIFDEKSRSSVRLDQGWGQGQDGFYLRVNEAF